ncbi:MAG: tetratricopeptide repeat protein [Holophagaceae bacterium]|nr:tetratricopeptide repeat protein [Holophagaceae bacterium]
MTNVDFALALLLGVLIIGRWAQLHWFLPRTLRRAEASWNSSAPVSETTDLLSSSRPAASGETGYRILLLLGRARFAQGFRNQAWTEFLQAQLVRLPLWRRLLIQPFFRRVPPKIRPWRLRYGRMILKLAPSVPQIPHRLGILHIRRDQEGDVEKAWEHFRAVLPLAVEDPLLLEDLLLAALNRGEHGLAEQALALLMQRHGDPRLPWDRSAPSAYLLQQGRVADALALFRSLPPAFRTEPWHWAGESRALRRLGDDNGAWASLEEGLARYPDSFRLWVEKHQMALDAGRFEEARHCLERAEASLPPEENSELRWEWQVRRAEFAHWVDGDPLAAWEFLRTVPADRRGNAHPPLDLELQVALGDFENALARCKELLEEHPGDPSLLLLQGDCLAGLEAWSALLDFLEGLGPEPRKRAVYWHLKGLALGRQGDALASRMDLERAAHMDPEDLRLVLDAGHACADLGEWERSENHWRQALHLDQACEEALVQLAESRSALHDPEGARRFLRECLVHHPESGEARERLAELESN